jgi:hypothetical protein
MQASNPGEQVDTQKQTTSESSARDPSVQRHSMSAEEIADAYADVADKLARWRNSYRTTQSEKTTSPSTSDQ